MSSLWQIPAVVMTLVAWLSTPPASIADAARREALRRTATPASSMSITNIGRPEPSVPVSVLTEGGLVEPPPPQPPPTTAPEDEQQGEKWWRARIQAARTALERDQVLADALQSRINALQSDVIFIDDPARQGELRRQLGKALGELDRMKKQVEDDTKAIKDIQDEARRKNIPPGWIR